MCGSGFVCVFLYVEQINLINSTFDKGKRREKKNYYATTREKYVDKCTKNQIKQNKSQKLSSEMGNNLKRIFA